MTKTIPDTFTIQDDFPAATYEQWRSIVEDSLHGVPLEKKLVTHTYEGIDLQPIYGRDGDVSDDDAIGFPGISPYIRGSRPLGSVLNGWDLRQEHAHPDLQVTNRSIMADLNGGVTSILLQLDAAARSGFDPGQDEAAPLAGQGGVMAYCVEDFDAALANVHLNMVAVALDAGAASVAASAALMALWRRRGVSTLEARGAFNADPIAFLARSGELPQSSSSALAALADLAKWTSAHYPNITAVGVDTSPYHDAGATAVQDIAFAVATGLEYLRAMTGAGMSIDSAAQQILFRMGLGTHHFLAIGKLRAARCVWSRVIDACGGSGNCGAMRIHTRTSDRVLTQHAPYVNLLRNSVAVFAAGVGGADAITSVPFDAMIGLPDEFSRRVARNTVLVLQEEAHLHRVIDPAGGSWFLDQLTEELAGKAWAILQEIEHRGGMLSALKSGWISEQIDAAHEQRAKSIALRKEGITGVSEFPDVDEERAVHAPPDTTVLRAAAALRIGGAPATDPTLGGLTSAAEPTAAAITAAANGATLGQISSALGFRRGPTESITPIVPRPFAQPFEQLRDACEAWQVTHGHRPRVFLANLGPASHHAARATWSKNFFEAGGFEVIGNQGFENADAAAAAFASAGASIAVICSSDKLYPEIVPQAAAKLRDAGARSILLAGNPGANEEAWRAAGVDRFIFIKCNVLETLRELLSEQGVLKNGEPTR